MINYLAPEKVFELVGALVATNQCTPEGRIALLAGIDKGFVAQLSQQKTPFDQIWQDVNDMNGVSFLANQQVPLLIWLQNAAQRLKMTGYVQETVFRQAADAVAAERQRRLQAGHPAASALIPSSFLGETEKEYRDYLARFLRPFEMTLHFTLSVFEQLRDTREMMSLEYHPGRLQEFYSNLPAGDPRRDLWRMYVNLLQEENSKGLALIDANYGNIILPEFRQACDAYRLHAKQWKVVWDALATHAAPPEPVADQHRLYAPQFPPSLAPSLAAEIAEASHRAGSA